MTPIEGAAGFLVSAQPTASRSSPDKPVCESMLTEERTRYAKLPHGHLYSKKHYTEEEVEKPRMRDYLCRLRTAREVVLAKIEKIKSDSIRANPAQAHFPTADSPQSPLYVDSPELREL